MRIVLLGYRGCGKSTVGRLIAERAGIELIDTDQLISLRAKKTIRQIFESEGEARFRELESAVLEDVARWPGSRVVSTGGGIVLKESNRNLLRSSGELRIYLQADADVLWNRIQSDPTSTDNRPALTALGVSIEEIESMLQQRDPLYREVATHVIDAKLDRNEIVESILKLSS